MATLKLYWDSVQNAVSYNVYWKTSPGVTTADSVVSGITDIIFHHTGLQENTIYYYIVVAVDFAGNLGPASVEFNGQTSTISAFAIGPNNANIGVGAQQRYTAVVTFSDGYSQDVSNGTTWDTTNHAIATIDSTGLATAISVGSVNIQGSYLTFNTTAPLIVSHTLVSIDITPTNETILALTTQQYVATGHYNDFSTADITTQVTWQSTNTSAATISNSLGSEGYATAGNGGSTTISATLGLVNASTALSVTPVLQTISISPTDPTVIDPNTQQFLATGHYTDGSTADLTNVATWASTNTGVATINSSGLLSTVSSGSTVVSATLGITGTTNVTVTDPLLSIAITPTSSSVLSNGTVQYTAIGHYSSGATQDISTSATWSSSNISAATLNSSGLATTGSARFYGWSQDNLALAGGTTMQGAFAVSRNEAFVVGNSNVNFKWNGSVWNTMNISVGVGFGRIKGTTTGSTLVASQNGGGFMAISTDHGATWPTSSSASSTVNALYVATDSVWYYGDTSRKIWKTTDAGVSWTTVLTSALISSTVWDIVGFGANDVWAVISSGTGANVAHYDGTSWTETALPNADFRAIFGFSGSQMYVGGYSGDTVFASYSTDGFVTRTDYPTFSSGFQTWSMCGYNGAVYFMGSAGTSDNIIYVSRTPGTVSRDPLSITFSIQPPSSNCGAASISSDGFGVIACAGQNEIIVNQSTNWFEFDDNSQSTPIVNDMAIIDEAHVWISAGNGLWSLNTQGTSGWVSVLPQVTYGNNNAVYGYNLNSTLWTSTQNAPRLRYSIDGGTTWNTASILPSSSPTEFWASSTTDIWMVEGSNARWSLDNGTTWNLNTFSQVVTGIQGTSTSNVWVSGANGFVAKYDGTSWTTVTAPAVITLERLCVNSTTDAIVVGHGLNAVYRTTDGGITWTQQTMTSGGVGSIYYDCKKAGDGYHYITGSIDANFAVWRHDLSTSTWPLDPTYVRTPENGLGGGVATHCIAVDTNNTFVSVAGTGGRTWIKRLSQLSTNITASESPIVSNTAALVVT